MEKWKNMNEKRQNDPWVINEARNNTEKTKMKQKNIKK